MTLLLLIVYSAFVLIAGIGFVKLFDYTADIFNNRFFSDCVVGVLMAIVGIFGMIWMTI